MNPIHAAVQSLHITARVFGPHGKRYSDLVKAQRAHPRRTVWDLLYSDPIGTESWLCVSMIVLAVMQAIPAFHFFSLVSQMVSLVPQPWGSLWLGSLGAFRLYVVANRLRGIRQIISVLSFFTWAALFSLSLTSQWEGGASLMLLMFAAQSFWVFMRMSDREAD